MRRGPSPISKRIRIINNKFRELWDKNLQKYNLTGVQMEVLCYLKGNRDKEIHQREIEYWFQLKNPTVTGILNRLEEKGYITRRRNPEDGRYRIIEVTEKGNRVMEDMGEGARDLDERIYDCMTDEEQAKLLELLDRILETMSENDGSGTEHQAWKDKHHFPDEIAANTVNTD